MVFSQKQYLYACTKILQNMQEAVEKVEKNLRTTRIEVKNLQKQDFQNQKELPVEKKEITPVQLDSGLELKKNLDQLHELLQKAEYKLHNYQTKRLLDYLVQTVKTYSYNLELLSKIDERISNHRSFSSDSGYFAENAMIDYQEKETRLVSNDELACFSNMSEQLEVVVNTDKLINIENIQDIKRKAHKETVQDQLEVFREEMAERFDNLGFRLIRKGRYYGIC